jgi:hypothetical protein
MSLACTDCGHVLVGQDEMGWYYQVPVTDPGMPGWVFMDRVHECDGTPHRVEQSGAAGSDPGPARLTASDQV